MLRLMSGRDLEALWPLVARATGLWLQNLWYRCIQSLASGALDGRLPGAHQSPQVVAPLGANAVERCLAADCPPHRLKF